MTNNDFKWINIGNFKAVEFLEKSLKNDQLANFYIFSGPTGLGKFALAKNFAKNIFLSDRPDLFVQDNFLEVNSDFFVIEREEEKKNISIDQVRDLIERMKSGSFLNSYKIAIIKDAENLNDNSANALLKILEETGKKTIIILTVKEADLLPKTILSRGQLINFYPVSDDVIYKNLVDNFSVSPSLAKNLTKLSASCPMTAIKFLQDENLYNYHQEIAQSFLEFLDTNFAYRVGIIDEVVKRAEALSKIEILQIWQSVLRDLILVNCGQYDLVRNEFMLDKLKEFSKKYSRNGELGKKIVTINSALEYHQANINFKAVLEYLAVNI